MARKTSREISRLFAAEKQTNPAAVAALSLSVLGNDKALKFSAKVAIGANEYDLAADNGKAKTFPAVDDAIKFVAKAAEKGDGVYTVTVDTGALLASKVPADLKADAANKVITLGKAKLSQQATIAGIDDQLALMVGWENGNQAQKAKKLEAETQKATVTADIAAIDAEVVRLTAIVNS